jgi:hypothetical protein
MINQLALIPPKPSTSIFRTRIPLQRKKQLEAENSSLREAQTFDPRFVALSKGMQQIQEIIEQVAPSDAHVLITGESGTGKGGHRLPATPAITPSLSTINHGQYGWARRGSV